jgi:hypothetical protein
MAGPINPITLAMIGAAGGAALKPNNPLQGALLGATAGYTGGTALGVGGATTAAGGGTGLTMGAGGTGLTAAGAGLSPTGGVLGTTGLTGASGVGLTAPAATAGYGLAAPAAASAAMAPTFMERVGMAGSSAYENPMMTAQALNATQGLLTPEQQPPSAPAMPLQTGRGVKAYNPMESLDPYRQSVVGGQPISLI